MGIFSKKKNNDFFQLIEEKAAAPAPYEVPQEKADENTLHPDYVLTTDEILASDNADKSDTATDTGPSDPLAAMRERMLRNVSGQAEKKPEEAPSEKTVDASTNTAEKKAENDIGSYAGMSFDEIISGAGQKPEGEKPSVDKITKPAEKQENNDTLLNRLMPYIVDEEGNDTSLPTEPLYKLESVADILRTESERTLEALSAKYDIIVEDIKRDPEPVRENTEKPAEQAAPEKREPLHKTVTVSIQEQPIEKPQFKAPAKIKASEREQQIFEEILAGLHSADTEEDTLPDLSDIDNAVVPRRTADVVGDDTATVRFTPVRNEGEGERLSVSTITRPIDLTGEFSDISSATAADADDGHLEQTEFEDFESKDEYAQPSDAKRLSHRLSVKKRSAFLQLSGSIIATMVLAVFVLPGAGDFIIKNVRVGMILCTALLSLVTLINGDTFVSLRHILSRRSSADCIASLAAVCNIALGVTAAVSKENEYNMLLLGAVILVFRAFGKFCRSSADLGNFRQIILPRPKKAVALLTDEATTFSMSKNAIEGDALIAVPRETVMVGDFMKYTDYSSPLGNRMRIVTLASALLAVIVGFICATYFRGSVYGFYGAAVIMSLAALPTVFLIDNLPVYRSAVRLNKKGAMIAGMAAANHLEMANAVVVSSRELFPDGMVVMHDMKVLSDNSIDEIILRAASLTEAANSPLAPIFKRIAGTNKTYTVPDSDTVKYEELRGISGWVENEILFIGNRTLMESHSIAVPDIEVDRKILRRGFFPVYIATSDKVCALLMVQYNVDADIAHELHRLTSLGVTVLVDNCDPNLTDEMICDYMGLYEDSVKTMSNSGVHMYRNAVAPTDRCSAPAAFRGNPMSLISIVNCAARMKRSNLLLTVFYLIVAVLGMAVFVYISFAGSDMPVAGSTVLIGELAAAVLSYLIFLLKKP